jgi:threonine dehydrogenase-like Zn-dependent dehydrogenase
MRGLWLENQNMSYRENIPVPQPAKDEALIRVLRAGICNTDLELMRGYYPFTGIIGHEFVGIVEQASQPAWVGAKVCGEINVSCGECSECRGARFIHCTARTVLGISGRDGAFADYLTLPLRNLHRVPQGVSDDEAAFSEPLAAAVGILEQVAVHPTDRVVVIGDGKLGNMISQVLALTGANLLAIGMFKEKLALLEKRGIATGFAQDIVPHKADVVVECTGDPTGLELARLAVRPRGTIVLKSTYKGTATVNFSAIVVDEVTLVGSRSGPIGAALSLLAKRVVDVLPFIQTHFPLEKGLQALEAAAKPGAKKIILTIAE